MSPFRLAVIGDLHYDPRSPRVNHLLEVLDWVIEDGASQGVGLWVLAGDICEGAPAGGEYTPLVNRIKAMGEQSRVLVILGNHCAYDALDWWPSIRGSVCVSNRDVLHIAVGNDDDSRCSVLAIPYPRRGHPPFDNLGDTTIAGSRAAAAELIRKFVQDAVAAAQAVDASRPVIGVGHFTISGMRTQDTVFEQHHATEVIVPRDAFDGLALMAVGHIHSAQWFCPACTVWNHDAGGFTCRCGYCGIRETQHRPCLIGVGDLIRNDFAEAKDLKSYTLVTVEGREVRWERRSVPAREMVEWHLQWTEPASHLAEIDAVAATCAGKEVKIVVEIPEDRVATYDPVLFAPITSRAAYHVIDRRVIAIERVRAPQLKQAVTIGDQVVAWLDATGQTVDDARRQRLVTLAEAL